MKNVAVGGTNREIARGIVVQSNGKIVIAGAAEHDAQGRRPRRRRHRHRARPLQRQRLDRHHLRRHRRQRRRARRPQPRRAQHRHSARSHQRRCPVGPRARPRRQARRPRRHPRPGARHAHRCRLRAPAPDRRRRARHHLQRRRHRHPRPRRRGASARAVTVLADDSIVATGYLSSNLLRRRQPHGPAARHLQGQAQRRLRRRLRHRRWLGHRRRVARLRRALPAPRRGLRRRPPERRQARHHGLRHQPRRHQRRHRLGLVPLHRRRQAGHHLRRQRRHLHRCRRLRRQRPLRPHAARRPHPRRRRRPAHPRDASCHRHGAARGRRHGRRAHRRRSARHLVRGGRLQALQRGRHPDHFWSAAVSPDKASRVVGIAGAETNGINDDDGVVLPIGRCRMLRSWPRSRWPATIACTPRPTARTAASTPPVKSRAASRRCRLLDAAGQVHAASASWTRTSATRAWS